MNENLKKARHNLPGIMARAQYKADRLKAKGWKPVDFARAFTGGPKAQKEVWDEVQRRKNVTAESIVNVMLEWGGRLATSEWTGYWMDSNGDMTLVDDHIGWARRYVLKTALPSPKNDAEYEQAVSGVYAAMSKLGWLKITVEFGKIFIQPTRATRTQMAALQEFAIENHLPILDQQTGRKIYDPKDDNENMGSPLQV